MDGEVIQLGQSIRVTLTSHEVAQMAEISELIHFYVVFRSEDQMVPNDISSRGNRKQRPPSYFGGSKTDI